MEDTNSYNIWQKEKEIIDELRTIRPELLAPVDKTSESILQTIGIRKSHNILGSATLKATFADFIVEEIQNDETIITIDSSNKTSKDEGIRSEKEKTIYATLVKIGISTLEAVNRIAEALNIDKTKIGYAGIKDAVAITAQRISIRGDVSLNKVKSLVIPQIILKDLTYGKGVVGLGTLKGNRFSIVLRTSDQIDSSLLDSRIKEIQTNGLLNYYGPQRFGSPRFQSHYLGHLVLTGQYEQLVRAILVRGTSFEWPLVLQLRSKASKVYGNWQEMKNIFSLLPYTFRQELIILDNLTKVSSRQIDWLRTLSPLFDQLDFWAKSYASLLANEFLSDSVKLGNKLPEIIPLLLNTKDVDEVNRMYWPYLDRDGAKDFRSVMDKSHFIRRGENSYIPTRIFPQNIVYKIIPEGVVIGFDLPKGAYATTVLYELFDILQEDETISKNDNSHIMVDGYKILGRGDAIMTLSGFITKYGKK